MVYTPYRGSTDIVSLDSITDLIVTLTKSQALRRAITQEAMFDRKRRIGL